MAKIIFWKSAIDPNQKVEYETNKTNLYEILKEIDAENEPLSVIVNGEIPDNIPLDFEFNKNDILEIRKIVHGNSSNSKNAFATIISIVALVAATAITGGVGALAGSGWWAAGITLAGGIASGALRYRAAKLASRNNGPSQSELDVDANALSLTSATNDARPLQPLPVPMGSVRVVPDYNGQPFPGMWGGSKQIDTDIGKESLFNPGLGLNPEQWFFELPAGFVSTSPYLWPAYPVKIMTGTSPSYIDLLTVNQKKKFAPYIEYPEGSGNYSSRPIIIYHDHPSDPNRGRFSNLASLYLQGTQSSSQSIALNDYKFWFDKDIPWVNRPSWWSSMMLDLHTPPGDGNASWINVLNIPNKSRFIPQDPAWQDPFSHMASTTLSVQNYMFKEINGETLPLDRVPNTPAPSVRFREFGQLIFLEPSKRSMTHVFNFGFGDLDISDHRVGNIKVTDITNSELVTVDRITWLMPITANTYYHSSVGVQEGADLANDEDFRGPETLVPTTDLNSYNFIYRSSPPNVSTLEFDLEGSLYETTNSGLSDNYVTFEVQVKNQNDISWNDLDPITLQNKGLSPIRLTFRFNFFIPGPYEIRVRKVEHDENNNNNEKVASFSVTAFKWFRADGTIAKDPTDFMGQNPRGLFLVANTQTNGQTNKYSALADAKCWVYDDGSDSWNWEFTRNPAWWFLYFARGGFKNPEADGTYVFPWSPTYGWVNGVGHPDSTEILFGCGMDDSKIDIDGLKDWASFCDDKNLFIDIVFKDASTEIEILEKIANIGRASVSYYKGLLSVVYEDSTQIPVGLYGMGNIIQGSFAADYSVVNIPSKVIGNFINRDNDWETETVEALVPFSDQDDLNFITATLDGVTTKEQAQREVNILAARQFFQKRTYTWKVDREGLVAKRGDLVYLSHDSTQFSYSGRVLKFIIDDLNNIIGIETTSDFVDNDINFVTIRLPNGILKTYSCRVDNCSIIFNDIFLPEDGPYYINGNNDIFNDDSIFPNSMPEDYIFIAGPLSTAGKVVRIAQIQPDENMNFTLTAVDEDPAMWSYEYGPVIDPESFNDSLIVSRVYNVSYKQLGGGKVKLFWEVDGADFIKILNVDTGTLVNADGQLSFSKGEVILELIDGYKYTLSIEPFVVGAPYKQENKVIIVWA